MFQRKRADQVGLGDVIRCPLFTSGTVDKDDRVVDSIHVGGTYPPGFRLKLSVDPTRAYAYYVIESIEGGLQGDWRWVYARRLGDGLRRLPDGEIVSFSQKLDRHHVALLEFEYYGRLNKHGTALMYEVPGGRTENR